MRTSGTGLGLDQAEARERMVRRHIAARGIESENILSAMGEVPREAFLPPELLPHAYEDRPLPIGEGQTISQPFIVALMTEMLELDGDEKVLEIGTGSGYQTAILARLARIVYSAEVEPELAATVRERLAQLGIENVVLRAGNGVEIFRDEAPFDRILSAAAPEQLPEELIDQLADGGRCIIPIGAADLQHLWLIEKRGGQVVKRRLEAVRFVPLRERA